MDTTNTFIYAGFWNRFVAFVIDVVVVSVIVFPFALMVGLAAPNLILVEVPFGLFTTTEVVSEDPELIENNDDGSTSVVQTSTEKDLVLGIWENYYTVKTKRSDGDTDTSRELINPETGNKIDVTTSGDIELRVIFIYWILLEISFLQGSIGKKVMGLKVVTEDGSKPNVFNAAARNLLKVLSGFTILIGFMMAGWTSRKQALHDMIPSMLVVKDTPKTPRADESVPAQD